MKILIVIGTRPEAIKMAILYKILLDNPVFETSLCLTGQHQSLVRDALSEFSIVPDIELPLKEPSRKMAKKSSEIIGRLQEVYDLKKPGLVLVHGDTLSAYCACYCAFLNRIPVAHVEAGLRSYNNNSPFPEEVLRSLIARMASIHFAPGQRAVDNLREEGIKTSEVFITGNTGVDALLEMLKKLDKLKNLDSALYHFVKSQKAKDRKLILLTMHRRENHGRRMYDIIEALTNLVKTKGISVIYTEHPSVQLEEPLIEKELLPYFFRTSALAYSHFVWLMRQADLILSDSGGIQEEAPYIAKPVIVLREETERQEVIEAGGNKIFRLASLEKQIDDGLEERLKISKPYGEGRASEKIARILEDWARRRVF